MKKELGKIKSIDLGYGGYDGGMFGLNTTLSGKGWVVSDFIGTWGMDIKVTEHTKWTEADRELEFANVMIWVNTLLLDAKKAKLKQLVGIPIEAIFDDSRTLTSWRVLTEVI